MHDSIEWTKPFDKDGRAALQVVMDARFGKGIVTIENRAVGGTNSEQLIAGTDGLNLPWPQSLKADIIIMNHAANDLGRESMTQYQANLRIFGSAGTPILYQTPNAMASQQNAPYAATIMVTAQSLRDPVADVFTYTSDLADWPTRLIDGTHPNPALYLEIVQKVQAPALVPLVARLRCERA
jgi:hypothetical protein